MGLARLAGINNMATLVLVPRFDGVALDVDYFPVVA
jgi:hypothetical protein